MDAIEGIIYLQWRVWILKYELFVFISIRDLDFSFSYKKDADVRIFTYLLKAPY